MSWGALIGLAFLLVEGWFLYSGLMNLARAVPECLVLVLGVCALVELLIKDVRRWWRRRHPRYDEDGIPYLE